MTRPLIQTDEIGTSREMTEEEFANYEAVIADAKPLPSAD
jgi:hypothetical protein